jgi:hypothetical protein
LNYITGDFGYTGVHEAVIPHITAALSGNPERIARKEIGVMSSVVSELPVQANLSAPRAQLRREPSLAAFAAAEESELASGRGFARAALIGLACWAVLGLAIWKLVL